jgi:hypothetical protein
MLQVPHMDVIRVDRDVAHIAFVASVSDECHKRFFQNVSSISDICL